MAEEHQGISTQCTKAALNLGDRLLLWLLWIVKGEDKACFLRAHFWTWNAVSFRNHEIMYAEMEVTGVDFRCIRISEYSLKSDSKFSYAGLVIMFVAITDTSN